MRKNIGKLKLSFVYFDNKYFKKSKQPIVKATKTTKRLIRIRILGQQKTMIRPKTSLLLLFLHFQLF